MSEYLCSGRGFTYEGCNDCRGVRWSKGRLPADVKAMPACTCTPRWVLFTKRTDDPKLGWIERELTTRGIVSRRNGKSFHGPILEVAEADLDRAWEILNAKVGRRRVDDLPDDHRMFQ